MQKEKVHKMEEFIWKGPTKTIVFNGLATSQLTLVL